MEAYRIFNASFHNLTVLTYDHVLARAQRIAGMEMNSSASTRSDDAEFNEDIPF